MPLLSLFPPTQMYDNIASLRFDVGGNGETVAGALVSAEGEVMDLKRPVPAEGRVEDWMTGVLLEMRRTNRLITKEAIFRYCEDRGRLVCFRNTRTYSCLQSKTLSVCKMPVKYSAAPVHSVCFPQD